MLSTSCSVCKKRGVAEGFSLTKLFHLEDNTQLKTITKWCRECLTKYSREQCTKRQDYIPKLRDTNIQSYHNVVREVSHFETWNLYQ